MRDCCEATENYGKPCFMCGQPVHPMSNIGIQQAYEYSIDLMMDKTPKPFMHFLALDLR